MAIAGVYSPLRGGHSCLQRLTPRGILSLNLNMSPARPRVASGIGAIPFNLPPVTGNEIAYITDAIRRREFEAYNHYTGRCQAWLQKQVGARDAILTHSCTAALEMAAILADLAPGDEVIMPSYT